MPILGEISADVFFVLCVITVYKVNKLPGLDILLATVFTEYSVEQFKGLSCCVPLGQPVHPSGLLSVFFFFSFSFLFCINMCCCLAG